MRGSLMKRGPEHAEAGVAKSVVASCKGREKWREAEEREEMRIWRNRQHEGDEEEGEGGGRRGQEREEREERRPSMLQ
eukprot:745901-Hanusia_phi.AAC.3